MVVMLCCGGTRRCLSHLLHGGHDLLRAIGQSVDAPRARSRPALFIFLKRSVNASQNSFKWHAGLAPGLNQRPVQGGKQKHRTAFPLEVFFDFRKVVEIVFQDVLLLMLVAEMAPLLCTFISRGPSYSAIRSGRHRLRGPCPNL